MHFKRILKYLIIGAHRAASETRRLFLVLDHYQETIAFKKSVVQSNCSQSRFFAKDIYYVYLEKKP